MHVCLHGIFSESQRAIAGCRGHVRTTYFACRNSVPHKPWLRNSRRVVLLLQYALLLECYLCHAKTFTVRTVSCSSPWRKRTWPLRRETASSIQRSFLRKTRSSELMAGTDARRSKTHLAQEGSKCFQLFQQEITARIGHTGLLW